MVDPEEEPRLPADTPPPAIDRASLGAQRRERHSYLLKRLHKDPEKRRQIQWRVIELYFAGLKMKDICAAIKKEMDIKLGLQNGYNYLYFAPLDGQLLHTPPRNARLQRCLENCRNSGELIVSDYPGSNPAAMLANLGAELVLKLVREIGAERKGPVHLGIGIGRTTGLLVDALARLYRGTLDAPPLVIHALATSWTFWDADANPHTFFGYFSPRGAGRVELVGLLGPPAVKAEEYARLRRDKFLKAAFDRREEVDVVVTSLASAEDQRGYLHQYLEGYDEKSAVARLRKLGWIGDVHLRPYSKQGPIEVPKGMMKPVTLFELKDLVRVAKSPGKQVVMLCCSDPRGDVSKAPAMEPLLMQPKLHVWSHLLLDLRTAEDLVRRNPGWQDPA